MTRRAARNCQDAKQGETDAADGPGLMSREREREGSEAVTKREQLKSRNVAKRR